MTVDHVRITESGFKRRLAQRLIYVNHGGAGIYKWDYRCCSPILVTILVWLLTFPLCASESWLLSLHFRTFQILGGGLFHLDGCLFSSVS